MKDKIRVSFSRSYTPPESGFYEKSDLVLLERKAFSDINYKRELSGVDEKILKMSAFSKKLNAPCFIALKSDDYGQVKKSIAVFEKGNLLAILDANSCCNGESATFGFRVLKTSVGRIGVLVSRDIKNVEAVKSLCMCESQLIVNLYADVYDFGMQSLVSSICYLYGVPIISCGVHGVIACTANGKIDFFSENDNANFLLSLKRSFKEVTLKTTQNYY